MAKKVHQLSFDAVTDPNKRRAAARSPFNRPTLVATTVSGTLDSEKEHWVVDDRELETVDGESFAGEADPTLIELQQNERVQVEIRDRDGGLLFVCDGIVDIGFTRKKVEGTTLIVRNQSIKIES